jgi:hypothetical protein
LDLTADRAPLWGGRRSEPGRQVDTLSAQREGFEKLGWIIRERSGPGIRQKIAAEVDAYLELVSPYGDDCKSFTVWLTTTCSLANDSAPLMFDGQRTV